jgi:uncharacterized protein (DUF433 family)
MTLALTSNEVVALSGVDELRLRKDMEYGVIAPSSPPRFELDVVVYLSALAKLPFDLGVADRRRLRETIANALSAGEPPALLELGEFVELRLRELVRQVVDRRARFEAWKKRLTTSSTILGGEPAFPGTRLAVRAIGSMVLRGVDREELREDYPQLGDEDLEYARMFVIAYPRRGRPRAPETAPR